jgi:hypothetical protein
MCAEPVRYARGGGGGGGYHSGGWSPALKGIIIAAVAAVLLVGGFCGMGIWQMGKAMRDLPKQMAEAQAQIEADRKARTVVVPTAELLQDFQKDPVAADQKYKGKYLELTGVVERTGKEREFVPFVILHAGDESAKVKVECFFEIADQAYRGRLDGLKKGDKITVRGEYSGQVSHIQLRMCEFPDMPRPAFWGGGGGGDEEE